MSEQDSRESTVLVTILYAFNGRRTVEMDVLHVENMNSVLYYVSVYESAGGNYF